MTEENKDIDKKNKTTTGAKSDGDQTGYGEGTMNTPNLGVPSDTHQLSPRIAVVGVGGAGGNAVNNMIHSSLEGVEFIVANTDAQALNGANTDRRIQLGVGLTEGLGAGSRPDVGRQAAEEALDDILHQLEGSHMAFVTAGMGGGTGTGAAPVIAQAARDAGILTVGVVTKPFQFEGQHRARVADEGIQELARFVDTLIIIPNQNLFRVANEKTTFADAFKMADDVLHDGVRGITDLMVMPGLINLDFADIRAVMTEMGKAMMGTGEAEGDKRAVEAAEAAISNPLLDDTSMSGARGVLINITGGNDITLFEVDEAANRIRDEVDPDANIIFGSCFDERLAGKIRVSVVATGIEGEAQAGPQPTRVLSVVEGDAQGRTAGDSEPASQTERLASAVQGRGGGQGTGQRAEPQQPAAGQAGGGRTAWNGPAASRGGRTSATAGGGAQAAGAAEAAAEPELTEPRPQAPGAGFIPEAPAEPGDLDTAGAAPGATATSEAPARPSGEAEGEAPATSIFRRMTRMDKGRDKGGAQAERPARGQETRASGESQGRQRSQGRQGQPAEPPRGETREEPQQGSLDVQPADRVQTSQQQDEDLLDIPAFLRRQAN